MDLSDTQSDEGDNHHHHPQPARPKDLPTSLDDRRYVSSEYTMPETEMYDGWQGKPAYPTANGARHFWQLPGTTPLITASPLIAIPRSITVSHHASIGETARF